jgi:hypothetical protein
MHQFFLAVRFNIILLIIFALLCNDLYLIHDVREVDINTDKVLGVTLLTVGEQL